MVKVRVPASIGNVGPGFDCLALALKIYNEVELNLQDSLEIVVEGEGEKSLPRDESNLVYQAAKRLFDEIERPIPAVRLRSVNRIPLARGLGSSAATIVGGLTAANYLADKPLSKEQVFKLAAEMEGHPDNVAAAVYGGLAVSYQEGEAYQAESFHFDAPLKVILLVPEESLPTAEARAVLPQEVSLGEAIFNLSRTALLVGSLLSDKSELLASAVEDKLHQPHRASLIPHFEEIFGGLREAGALAVALSGAGPSFFCLVKPESEKQFCGRVKEFLDKLGLKHAILSTEVDFEGAAVFS